MVKKIANSRKIVNQKLANTLDSGKHSEQAWVILKNQMVDREKEAIWPKKRKNE